MHGSSGAFFLAIASAGEVTTECGSATRSSASFSMPTPTVRDGSWSELIVVPEDSLTIA